MATFFYALIKSLVLPPGLFILLLVLAFLLRRISLIVIALIALYFLSTPYVARLLIDELETYPVLTDDQIDKERADAIVVLGGGRYTGAPEYGGDTVGGYTLVRLRYAAYLHHKTDLPIIASGGSPYQEEAVSEAVLAKHVLENEFQTGKVMTEGKSPNTRKNALYTAKLLKRKGIESIYLVTHAIHMPRALDEFKRAGIEAIPAPTRFIGSDLNLTPTYRQWLPTRLNDTTTALKEHIGRMWYSLRNLWEEWMGTPSPAT